jgi:hypothetical protein
MKNEEGRLIYLNKTYENCFNVRFEDWRGKTDFELWPLGVAEQFRENDLSVLNSGQTIKVVEEMINPDGSSTFWWSSKFLFHDAFDKKYVGGIGIDIIERKQTQLLLKVDLGALTRIHELSRILLGIEGIQPMLQEIMGAAVASVNAKMGTLNFLKVISYGLLLIMVISSLSWSFLHLLRILLRCVEKRCNDGSA